MSLARITTQFLTPLMLHAVICIYEWQDQQFKVYFEQQIFDKFCFDLRRLTWGLNLALTSNIPTQCTNRYHRVYILRIQRYQVWYIKAQKKHRQHSSTNFYKIKTHVNISAEIYDMVDMVMMFYMNYGILLLIL